MLQGVSQGANGTKKLCTATKSFISRLQCKVTMKSKCYEKLLYQKILCQCFCRFCQCFQNLVSKMGGLVRIRNEKGALSETPYSYANKSFLI